MYRCIPSEVYFNAIMEWNELEVVINMQVREHQREVLSLNKEIGSLQAQLREAQRAAAKAKEQGTWKFISAAKEASAATKTASETRKDAEESLLNMAAHVRFLLTAHVAPYVGNDNHLDTSNVHQLVYAYSIMCK